MLRRLHEERLSVAPFAAILPFEPPSVHGCIYLNINSPRWWQLASEIEPVLETSLQQSTLTEQSRWWITANRKEPHYFSFADNPRTILACTMALRRQSQNT